MKRNGFFSLLLVALCVPAIAITAIAVGSQRANVVITETVRHGDPSAVDGMTITLEEGLQNGKLIWTSEVPLWDVSQTATNFHASRDESSGRYWDSAEFDVRLYSDLRVSTNNPEGLLGDSQEERYSLPVALFQDVASRAEVGEKYTETVRVADYTDVYLPEIRINYPMQWEPLGGGRYEPIGRNRFVLDDALWDTNILTDYFAVPVGEGDRLTVTVLKNERGKITSINLEMGEDFVAPETHFAFVGDDIYTATQRGSGGDITLARVEMGDGGASTNGDIRYLAPVAVHTLAVLPTDQRLDTLALREGGNQLLMVTAQEEIGATLHVLSLPTGEQVQEIPLPDIDHPAVNQLDGALVLDDYNGNFALLTAGEGGDQVAFSGGYFESFPDMEEYFGKGADRFYDYTDGTLAVLLRSESNMDGREQELIAVGVYTAEGCQFVGEYGSSLAFDPYADYEDGVHDRGNNQIHISH